MELTKETVAGFVGGQVAAYNLYDNYTLRGEIATATIEGRGSNAVLVLELKWAARGTGFPPGNWTQDPTPTLQISLRGRQCLRGSGTELILSSTTNNDFEALYSAGHTSLLDPTKVKGLNVR